MFKVTDFEMARDVQQENIYERKTKVIQQCRRVWNQLSVSLICRFLTCMDLFHEVMLDIFRVAYL